MRGSTACQPADGAATLTAFTAARDRAAARHFPARRHAAGSSAAAGARNPTLMRAIAEATRGPVVTAEEVGWDGDALEAQAFAYLAVRSLRGLPLSFPDDHRRAAAAHRRAAASRAASG